jgi:hypothetical protein
MTYQPHPEFARLFKTYTGDPDGIGAHLAHRMDALRADAPLLVSTGSDIVLFPGGGQAAVVESFRNTTRGFIELGGVSHLGTAVAWLVRMRQLDDPTWRADAERLIDQCRRTRAVNSEVHWREAVAVAAWSGLEAKIADVVDYACRVTEDFLVAGLADERLMTFDHLRTSYLDPVGSAAVPVPINDMMVGTFALSFLDIAHRIIGWVQRQDLDWANAMVMIAGRSGRPTAALTWHSNSSCHLLWRASGEQMSPEQLYIAPFAPPLALADLGKGDRLTTLEAQYREIWHTTRASVEVSRLMFQGYPAFTPEFGPPPVLAGDGKGLTQLPALRDPDDRFGAVTLLRYVLEDPSQLVSSAVAYSMIDQLCANGNCPQQVVVPCFTRTEYPARS